MMVFSLSWKNSRRCLGSKPKLKRGSLKMTPLSFNEPILRGYHPLESKPRTSGQERGVWVFLFRIFFLKALDFWNKILDVDLRNNQRLHFCVLYRPQSHKL